MNLLVVVFLGAGLATDASCVSASNGLLYTHSLKEMFKMALVFAVFQFIMPLIGYLGTTLLPAFIYDKSNIIACSLLVFIGGKMLWESYKGRKDSADEVTTRTSNSKIPRKTLILQGIATSIDALSVGFAFINMQLNEVVCSSLVIALVTFLMCMGAIKLGQHLGNKLNANAELIGGIVLIILGIQILIK